MGSFISSSSHGKTRANYMREKFVKILKNKIEFTKIYQKTALTFKNNSFIIVLARTLAVRFLLDQSDLCC